ncbi:hypothetical protein SeMB42_g02113 [Synchytrium endobioticum]|uniref:G-protein coupled receptors family 1 profile domain-containing protein n=1 Tax=Synchytrium endobioticum TaxID=286115 RepID=A0A507DGS3_9FUNG|nr:hypothetical protein SeLEV6574_g07962 [Synchytrium endobioticum]TPX44019.1 hypothetical protein SeLEV6574_g04757 [Synchytrium endobioticum]TPX50813.1 hypothetical protein SeMB42_g02113 [Synchytrium endobioticum]
MLWLITIRITKANFEKLTPPSRYPASAAGSVNASAVRQPSKVDPEVDMCLKFMMLSLVSIACNTPAVTWILYELVTGRQAPEPFVVLVVAFIALEPSLDCGLIIHMNPSIRNRILGWLKWIKVTFCGRTLDSSNLRGDSDMC